MIGIAVGLIAPGRGRIVAAGVVVALAVGSRAIHIVCSTARSSTWLRHGWDLGVLEMF